MLINVKGSTSRELEGDSDMEIWRKIGSTRRKWKRKKFLPFPLSGKQSLIGEISKLLDKEKNHFWLVFSPREEAFIISQASMYLEGRGEIIVLNYLDYIIGPGIGSIRIKHLEFRTPFSTLIEVGKEQRLRLAIECNRLRSLRHN